MRAVNQLPEQQRVAIVLCVISDLGPKETAAQMGKTAGAVRQLVRRGLRTIQKLVLGGETADATELD
jgi:RNA polymerase sigma factor (sigma-70 family)